MGSRGLLCRTQLVRARMRVNSVTVKRKTRRRFQGCCWVFFCVNPFSPNLVFALWSCPFFFFFSHGFGPGEEVTACDHGIVSPGLQPTLP